jgi:seryl-tRNA synthetase
MLDLRFIRENTEKVRQAIEQKMARVDLDRLIELDRQRRETIQKADKLKEQRNRVSEAISGRKKEGKDGGTAIQEMKQVSQEIKTLDQDLRILEEQIQDLLIRIPNIPHPSVPVGPDASFNTIVKEWGTLPEYDFKVKPHWDIGPALGILDFDRGSRLSGSNFVSYAGLGARLERALINFMIDLHTREHGYTEVSVPFITK